MDAASHERGSAREKSAPHVLPLKTYFGVYGALLVLTFTTVEVSLLDLGEAALYVAMAVAIAKSSLVVLYFMHLKFDARFNSLVFLSSLMFLVIFFSFTMLDLQTRGDVQEVEDNFSLHSPSALEKQVRSRLSQDRGARPPAARSSPASSGSP